MELNDDKYVTHENGSGSAETNLLELVFKDGKRLRKHTHAEIMTVIDDAHSFGSSVQASTDTYSRH